MARGLPPLPASSSTNDWMRFASRELDSDQSHSTGFPVSSGSNSFMVLARSDVFAPRSFWNTAPYQRHHSGIAKLGGIGEDGEASSHVSVDDIIFRSTLGMGALLGETVLRREFIAARFILDCRRMLWPSQRFLVRAVRPILRIESSPSRSDLPPGTVGSADSVELFWRAARLDS